MFAIWLLLPGFNGNVGWPHDWSKVLSILIIISFANIQKKPTASVCSITHTTKIMANYPYTSITKMKGKQAVTLKFKNKKRNNNN